MEALLAHPQVAVILLAVVAIALFVGYKLITDLSAQRGKLLLDARNRADAAAKAQAGDPTLNVLANVFDPLGLFHH
jgi:hypothetical protein